MKRYTVEQRLITKISLLEGVEVVEMRALKYPNFITNSITFEPWEFTPETGVTGDAWVARFETDYNLARAYTECNKRVSKIINKIAFIAQSYISEWHPNYMVRDNLKHMAYVGLSRPRRSPSLMFWKKDKKALDYLIGKQGKHVPGEFFAYWRDATNTSGYAPKLLTMLAAIEVLGEAMVKHKSSTKKFGAEILGQRLADLMYSSPTGLRHRLVHGKYFSPRLEKNQGDYVKRLHKKVVEYFNKEIFGNNWISEDVVNPQRPMTGRGEFRLQYIKQKTENFPLDLRSIWGSHKKSDDFGLPDYSVIYDAP